MYRSKKWQRYISLKKIVQVCEHIASKNLFLLEINAISKMKLFWDDS